MLSFSLLEDYAPIMPADCCQVVDGYWMMKYHLIQRKALMQTNGVQIVSSDVVVRSWFVMTSRHCRQMVSKLLPPILW